MFRFLQQLSGIDNWSLTRRDEEAAGYKKYVQHTQFLNL